MQNYNLIMQYNMKRLYWSKHWAFFKMLEEVISVFYKK